MGNLPITSRVKRSPLLKTDPTDPKAKAYGSEEGKDKQIQVTETKKKDYVGAANDACSAEYIAKNGRAKCDEYKALSQSKKDKANTETVTTTKTVEGEDLNYDTDLYKQKKGDVLEPWEKRRMSRGIKKEQRDIRRAKQKLARAEKRGNTIKADEARAELGEFEAMAGRGKSARATGYATGKRDVQTGQEKVLKGDRTPEQQKEQRRQEAKREQAKKDGVTTASSDFAKDLKSEDYSLGSEFSQSEGGVEPVNASVFSDFEEDLKSEDYSVDSAFKMRAKSPAAKKLQGNHESPAKLGPLAVMAGKAIIGGLVNKAASNSKMKSSFKMKGYGKR